MLDCRPKDRTRVSESGVGELKGRTEKHIMMT